MRLLAIVPLPWRRARGITGRRLRSVSQQRSGREWLARSITPAMIEAGNEPDALDRRYQSLERPLALDVATRTSVDMADFWRVLWKLT